MDNLFNRLLLKLFLIILFVVIIENMCVAQLRNSYVPSTGYYLGVSLGELADEGQMHYVDYDSFSSQFGNSCTFTIVNKFVGFPSWWSWEKKYDSFDSQWESSFSPGIALMFTLMPMVDFDLFVASSSTTWGPGNEAYDSTLAFAISCKKNCKRPIFIRFAHEMNAHWYPWCSKTTCEGSSTFSINDYIKAFRNVANVFHNTAPNVSMIWCPNYYDTSNHSILGYKDYYPGDDYVDWVGLDLYNHNEPGTKINKCDNYQFYNMLTFDNFYYDYCDTSNSNGHKKPLIICETSSEFIHEYTIDPSSTITIDDFEENRQLPWSPWGGMTINLDPTNPISGDYSYQITSTLISNDFYRGGMVEPITNEFDFDPLNTDLGISIFVKREDDCKIEPSIIIQFREDHDIAACAFKLQLSNYNNNNPVQFKEKIIPFDLFRSGSNSAFLSKYLRIDLHTNEITNSSSTINIDLLRVGNITTNNLANNIKWKSDWIDQILSTDNNGNNEPHYYSIKEKFPNLKAICLFHLMKQENGEFKDFRLPDDATFIEHFNEKVSTTYTLSEITKISPTPTITGDITSFTKSSQTFTTPFNSYYSYKWLAMSGTITG
ncbi:MAG: glycosyl hydrolase, partial [bacterium]